MLSRKLSPPAMLLIALILPALSGCASPPKDAPPPTVRKPKLTPLPGVISRIDLKPSTGSLSKASQWSENSERILKNETPK